MPTSTERDFYMRRALEIRGYAAAAHNADIRQTLEKMAKACDELVEEADCLLNRPSRG